MSVMGERLRIGDVVAHDPAPFWLDAEPRWHGLIVPPQRERRACLFLAGHGVHAFYPVRTVPVRRAGRVRRMDRALLPRYVFARMPGPVAWHRLLSLPFFADVIRLSDGRPAVLDPADLVVIHGLRGRIEEGERAAVEEADRRRSLLRPRRGAPARILSGAFAGEVADVVEIKGDRALLRLNLFARAVEAEVSVGSLVCAGG